MPSRFSLARSLPLLALSAALALSLARAASAQQGPVAMHPIPTISATGSATSDRSPDQAEVIVGVQATGKTSEEAQDALNKQMDKVIRAVKDTNLAGLVTQTQGLSLYPEYEREENNARNRPPRISGYRASTSILAKTSDVPKVGKLIDAAVAAGANQIMGVSFTLKNDSDARREAIGKATREARAKAQAMAEALGLGLGRVMQATTGGVQARPYRYNMPQASAMMMRGGAEAAPTPIEAGEVSVSAEVTVEFAIVDPQHPDPAPGEPRK